MSEKGLLKKVIKSYSDSKLAVIKKMVNDDQAIFDENFFLDDGYVSTKVNSLKKEYKNIIEEISFLNHYDKKEDDYKKNKLISLIQKQKQIQIDIAFYGSNNIVNVESCLNLIKDLDTDIKLCLDGLIFYKNHDISNALSRFSEFYSKKSYLLEHYLINKVYGTLLYDAGRQDDSMQFLRKAVEKRPEDLEIHELLSKIYKYKKLVVEEKIENEIILLLGGL